MADEKQDRSGGGGSGPSVGEGSTITTSEDAFRSHVGLERVAELDVEGELEPGVGVGEPGASVEAGAPAAEAASHPTPVPPAPLGKSMRALGSALHAHTARPAERRAVSREAPVTKPSTEEPGAAEGAGERESAPGEPAKRRGRGSRKRPPA